MGISTAKLSFVRGVELSHNPLLASGMSADEILREFPYLKGEDIQACLRFASARLDQLIIALGSPPQGMTSF